MTLARATPKDGFEKALVGLGQYEEAAVRLERLAQEATAARAYLEKMDVKAE